MKTAVALTISGRIFLFEDCNFTVEQQTALQQLAQNIFNFFPEERKFSEDEVCNRFLGIVHKELKIDLHEIKISFMLRINNKYT